MMMSIFNMLIFNDLINPSLVSLLGRFKSW